MDWPSRSPSRYRSDSARFDALWLALGIVYPVRSLGFLAPGCLFRAFVQEPA